MTTPGVSRLHQRLSSLALLARKPLQPLLRSKAAASVTLLVVLPLVRSFSITIINLGISRSTMFAELGMIGIVGVFVVIVVLLFLFALFFWGLKYAIAYALNAVIGFFALYAIQAFVWQDLIINYWSVAIVAIGGIFGFGIVLALHGLGLWF